MSQPASTEVRRPPAHERFAVLGAHGGAGTSTVTKWLDPDGALGSIELRRGGRLPLYYIPVVVAQSTAFGMSRAVDAVGRWHPEAPRPYLVVVRDAPLSLPKPAVYRMRTITPRVLGIAEVPYLAELRGVDTPGDGLDLRAVQRAARALRRSLGLAE